MIGQCLLDVYFQWSIFLQDWLQIDNYGTKSNGKHLAWSADHFAPVGSLFLNTDLFHENTYYFNGK
jgi:hypothetical protein